MSSSPDAAAQASAVHTSDATARLEAAARELFAAAEAALADEATAAVPDAVVQQMLTAGTRLFARKVENERRYFMPVTGRDAITATEAATMITEVLRAVDLNLFDLSMWAGRPRDGMEDPNADHRLIGA